MRDISNIKNITVVGTGFMGYGIAHVVLLAGFNKIILNDIKKESLDNAAKQIEIGLLKCEEMGKLPEGTTTKSLMARLVKELDLKKAVENADFIIEAVPERLDLKMEIYRKLGEYAPKNTIIASNTSFMDISKLGEASGKPEKVVGMHFIPPIISSRVIEVTKGFKTSNETWGICSALGEKLPCVSGDRFIVRIEKWSPGFILNRLLCAVGLYFSWVADKAIEKNIPWEQLDADIVLNKDSMGLCETWDYIGLDVAYDSMNYLKEYLSPDFAITSGVFLEKVKKGELGAKTGKGFYEWPKGRRYFFEWNKEWRPKTDRSKKAGLLDLETIIAIEINEGCKLLQEGVISGYQTIDDIMYIGSREQSPGPFITGKRIYGNLCVKLEELAKNSGKDYFKPCDLMKSGEFLKMRKPKPKATNPYP
ncbi:MAG: 3-hydroxyacyl-CoA dehydrogenase family protein [Candidatus Hodarchaeota archaeon]